MERPWSPEAMGMPPQEAGSQDEDEDVVELTDEDLIEVAPADKERERFRLDAFLPEADKEIIRHGLEALGKYLKGRKTMPKAVVFPDSSSRPLAYAVKPLLEKIGGKDAPERRSLRS